MRSSKTEELFFVHENYTITELSMIVSDKVFLGLKALKHNFSENFLGEFSLQIFLLSVFPHSEEETQKMLNENFQLLNFFYYSNESVLISGFSFVFVGIASA